jgi:uncharacterized protein
MKKVCLYLATIGLLLTSAPSMADDEPTVRICDSSGCSDRPVSSSTFQVEPEDPVLEQQRVALEELARKDPRAAWDLGLRYFRGDGVRRDPYQALQWMRDAGERGVVEAQLAVGRFYLMGLEEMGSDPAEAETWLSMAASKGNKEARKLLKEAQAAKKTEQSLYQWREAHRKSWYGYWYSGYPYYWTWGPRGWYYR